MKTVGQLLKSARLKKNISLKRVAKATKIRPEFLQALEADDFQTLPSLTSARGFVKNYAEFLSVSSQEALALFRRDYNQQLLVKKPETRPLELVAKLPWDWTPKTTSVAVGLLLGVALIAYLVWQYSSLMSAPYY